MATFRCCSIILFLLFIILPHPAFCTDHEPGDVGYISDFLIINIRDNIEKPYTVVAALKSDEKVKIIATEGNYYQVETGDGKKGWIATQYVKRERPKSAIIEDLQAEISRLRSHSGGSATATPAADASQTDSTEQLAATNERLLLAQNEVERLQTELQHAKAVIAAQPQNESDQFQDCGDLQIKFQEKAEAYQQLANDHVKRGERIAELENSLARQNNQTKYYWFGAGALVFFLGLLAGRSGSKKKSKFMY